MKYKQTNEQKSFWKTGCVKYEGEKYAFSARKPQKNDDRYIFLLENSKKAFTLLVIRLSVRATTAIVYHFFGWFQKGIFYLFGRGHYQLIQRHYNYVIGKF